jgi:NADH:ubiquinone oxidoreductase subunit 5 (subunit L)/multisubunit Na+/H+ antiporter MnhA subunit
MLLMLGIAFGLTALAFAKIAGEVLLGAPRRSDIRTQEKRGDVPWRMRVGLLVLAGACLGLGLFPGWVSNQLAEIPAQLLAPHGSLSFGSSLTKLEIDAPLRGAATGSHAGTYQVQLDMLPLLVGLGLPAALGLVLSWRRQRLTGELWTGGTAYRPEAMQISGSAFSYMVWSWLEVRKGRPRRESGEEAGLSGAAATGEWLPWRLPLSQNRRVREPFRQAIDGAVMWLITTVERFGNWFQGGDIRQYLSYLFVTFVIVLLIAVLWR